MASHSEASGMGMPVEYVINHSHPAPTDECNEWLTVHPTKAMTDETTQTAHAAMCRQALDDTGYAHNDSHHIVPKFEIRTEAFKAATPGNFTISDEVAYTRITGRMSQAHQIDLSRARASELSPRSLEQDLELSHDTITEATYFI